MAAKQKTKTKQKVSKAPAKKPAKPKSDDPKPAKAPPKAKVPKAKKEKKIKAPKPRPTCVTQDTALKDADLNTTKHKDWQLTVAALRAVCKKDTVTPRSSRCTPCKRAIRKEQLRVNNIEWRKRVEKGVAGHHSKYRNKPTEVVKKLKALDLDPAKYIKQGGKGEKAALPLTVAAKLAKVELAPAKKPATPKSTTAAKPTEAQKTGAKAARKAMKKAPATPEASGKKKAPNAKAARLVHEETPQVQKALGKLLEKSGLAPTKAPPAPTKNRAAEPGTPKPVPTTDPSTPRILHPISDGEIRASQAVQGRQYEVAGVKAEFTAVTSVGGEDRYSFLPGDGGKPMLLTPLAPVKPL